MKFDSTIGLEVHVQLNTNTKIFSGTRTQYGALPNTQANIIDLGMPGVLPVLNQAALYKAIKFGLSIKAKIGMQSVFSRKNYFYPDLPKGYQITQFDKPIVGEGQLTVLLKDGQEKIVGIERAHLEEDAGKSLHDDFHGQSGIDLNRAGTPLLEIVSKPCLNNALEAVAYLKTLHTLVKYLGICDGNMQEGSFRCDANVSIKPYGQKELGTRAEIKNVNSFRFVERAINYEIMRQQEVIEAGGKVVQETRLYDASTNETRPMRSKEEANDYRYFPEPDLLPVTVTPHLIDEIKATLPELPAAKRQRFVTQYNLSNIDANTLVNSQALADYYEATVKAANGQAKLSANWLMGDLAAYLNKHELTIEQSPVSAQALGKLVTRLADKTLSSKTAKIVFVALCQGSHDVDTIIAEKGLKQITDISAIVDLLEKIIHDNPSQWNQFKEGKDRLKGFFVGQVMKSSKGTANPEQVNEAINKRLAKS